MDAHPSQIKYHFSQHFYIQPLHMVVKHARMYVVEPRQEMHKKAKKGGFAVEAHYTYLLP